MSKSKWVLLITESFFPFLFFMIVFLAALLIIDNKIENRDDILLINLNQEDHSSDEEPSIVQTIEIKNLPANAAALVKEINNDIENQAWSKAILKIKTLGNNYKIQNSETSLTLAYLYFKESRYQDGVKTLNSIGENKSPRYYYNMGLLLGRQPRHYFDAINNFEKFLQLRNNSYEANMNIAHIYFRLEKYNAALGYYMKSAELSSLSRKAKALFGAGHCSEKLGKMDQAFDYLNQAIRLDPENVGARAHRAELELKTTPEKAVADLVKLTEIYPEFIDSYHILATYYLNHDENEKALNWMKTGLRQAPNSIRVRSNLGSIYLKMEEYEKALQIFQELSEQFPGDYFYYFNLARSYNGLENFKEAIANYNKALQIKPQYYEAFVNLGIIYSKLNNPDQAIYYYNKALTLDKSSSGTYFNLGILYNRSDRKLAAIDSYKKAITLDNKFPEAYYNMGLALSSIGKYSEAETAYLNAIKYKKDYVNSYYNLAFIYKTLNKPEKLLEILKTGIEITGDSKLKNRLGDFYKESDQINLALITYLDVIRNDPENITALREISEIYIRLKNFRESLDYIEKYINLIPKSKQGRYLNMIALYENKNYKEAMKQYEILKRISPDYKDSNKYRDLIKKEITSLN